VGTADDAKNKKILTSKQQFSINSQSQQKHTAKASTVFNAQPIIWN